MSKLVLYTFVGSSWCVAPELAIAELGYDGRVEEKVLNLVEGENFYPDFLRVNPSATLPTLDAGGKVLTNTTDAVSYLVENATVPVGKSSGTALIARIHDDNIDPNTAMLSVRNDEECRVASDTLPGTFVRHRQATLEKVAPSAPAELKPFYDAKIKGNGYLKGVFDFTATDSAAYYALSKAHWDRVAAFIADELPGYLPAHGFIGGEKPGADDFHVVSWLGRIGLLTGGTPGPDGVKAIAKELGGRPVPEKVQKYWWKHVYAHGLR